MSDCRKHKLQLHYPVSRFKQISEDLTSQIRIGFNYSESRCEGCINGLYPKRKKMRLALLLFAMDQKLMRKSQSTSNCASSQLQLKHRFVPAIRLRDGSRARFFGSGLVRAKSGHNVSGRFRASMHNFLNII